MGDIVMLGTILERWRHLLNIGARRYINIVTLCKKTVDASDQNRHLHPSPISITNIDVTLETYTVSLTLFY